MSGFATRMQIWSTNAVSRLRSAFNGLGHAAALLTFVIVATALKFEANNFARQTSAVGGIELLSREVVALASTLLISLPLLVANSNLAPAASLRRLLVLALGTGLIILIGLVNPLPGLIAGAPMSLGRTLSIAVLIVLLAVVLEFRHRALTTAGRLMRAEIDSITADTRLRDANLRVLQAQVAPHFLFNTLANVRRLARIDRRSAAAMLGDLIKYFSGALKRRDRPLTALGDEAQLIESYLRIHRVRMGARLVYAIDLPPELTQVQIPSMMLLTLVENAIKHGINPLTEGGFIRLRAERSGGSLKLEVADNGRGLTDVEGGGSGLANIRARLSMLYGSSARLELEHGRPRGFVARIELPVTELR